MLPDETAKTTLCKVTSCYRDADGLMCDHHRRMIATDLTWLAGNLHDLTSYRLNRAYGGNHEGRPSGTAPAPVRESLYDLLWSESDDGLPSMQTLLYEFARSLGEPATWDTAMERLAMMAAASPRLYECPATPVYTPSIHRATARLRRFVESGTDMIVYGECPSPGCDGRLAAPRHADDVECRKCGCRWNVAHLRMLNWSRILRSDKLGTVKQLAAWLTDLGTPVKPATLRSWAHRGRLPQSGEDDYSHPLYSLKQAYVIAANNLRRPRSGNKPSTTSMKGNSNGQ